jgi:outer membrane immunogenic protein
VSSTKPEACLSQTCDLSPSPSKGAGFFGFCLRARCQDEQTCGADVGCNLQNGSLIHGVEADVSALHESGSSFFGGKYFRKAKLTGLSTLRARVGYAFDRVLVYGTGGFALGQLKDSSGETNVSARTANISTVRAGWTLGGGIEYAYTAKWTVRAEGLYVNLGQTHATDAGNRGYGFKTTASIARVGLNYKF